MTAWEIRDGEREAYVSEGEGDVKSLLGDVISMWTQNRNLQDWQGKEKMAAICFYYSDLSEHEIKAIFGVTGEGDYPGEPHWELPHPNEGVLYIEKT